MAQGRVLMRALRTLRRIADVVGSLFSGHFSKVVSAVKSSTAEVELPAEVIEEAKAEIIAMRKRDGNMDETVEGLPTKVSLASL